jgi:hypothetical protein
MDANLLPDSQVFGRRNRKRRKIMEKSFGGIGFFYLL